MGALSPTHWAIIAILVLLLFGSRKLPDMARGVGQSLRIFKAETQQLRDDDKPASTSSASEGSADKATPQAPAAVEKGSSADVSATKSERAGESR